MEEGNTQSASQVRNITEFRRLRKNPKGLHTGKVCWVHYNLPPGRESHFLSPEGTSVTRAYPSRVSSNCQLSEHKMSVMIVSVLVQPILSHQKEVSYRPDPSASYAAHLNSPHTVSASSGEKTQGAESVLQACAC